MSDEQKQLIREKWNKSSEAKYYSPRGNKAILDFWLNELDLAIKQTEESIVEKIKKNDLCLYSGDVDSIITLIRNK